MFLTNPYSAPVGKKFKTICHNIQNWERADMPIHKDVEYNVEKSTYPDVNGRESIFYYLIDMGIALPEKDFIKFFYTERDFKFSQLGI